MNSLPSSAISPAVFATVRRGIPIVLTAVLIGCSSSPSRESLGGEGNSKSFITAVDDGFFKAVSSSAATTKIAGIDGARVEWSRFNTGSGFVSAGQRKILVRLWGENKRMGFPIGSSVGKVETYGCIAFEAQSSKSYEVSSKVGDTGYLVAVADVTEGSKDRNVIHSALVPFDSVANLDSCRLQRGSMPESQGIK